MKKYAYIAALASAFIESGGSHHSRQHRQRIRLWNNDFRQTVRLYDERQYFQHYPLHGSNHFLLTDQRPWQTRQTESASWQPESAIRILWHQKHYTERTPVISPVYAPDTCLTRTTSKMYCTTVSWRYSAQCIHLNTKGPDPLKRGWQRS